jgi:hypothetical protein
LSSQPQQNQEPEKRGFWHDLSIPQLIAGALAAVTSMLLSNQIGIAGSVIGVAVGSVVSAVSGAAYKSIIARSAHAVKQAIPASFERQPGPNAVQAPSPDETTIATGETTVLDPQKTTVLGTDTAPVDATRMMAKPVSGSESQAQQLTEQEDKLVYDEFGLDPYMLEQHVAPQELLARAKKRRQHEQLKLVLVTLLSGLVAVGVSAAVVLFLTQGEGLGEKRSIVTYEPAATVEEAQPEKTEATESTDKATEQNASATTDKTDATADKTDSTGKEQTSTESESENSSTSTGSASTGTTGSTDTSQNSTSTSESDKNESTSTSTESGSGTGTTPEAEVATNSTQSTATSTTK